MNDADGIDIKSGDRVAILPHTDLFMQGYRYGQVTKIGRTYLHVTAERLSARRTVRLLPSHVSVVLMAPWLV